MCPQPDDRSRIAASVLDHIEAKRIAMRSKLSLLAERLGLDSIGLLLVLAAVLALSLILFWARATGILAFFTFGSAGFWALLEGFPYLWLAIAVLAFIGGASVLRSTELADQPPIRSVLFIGVGAIVILGVTSLLGEATEHLVVAASQARPTSAPVRAVYALTEHRGPASLVGSVVETVPNGYIVQVGRETVVVTITERTRGATTTTAVPGDRVLIVGTKGQQQSVQAVGFRRLPTLQLPRIHWQQHRFPAPVST